MKKVLIISPYFPPSNAADAQRVRMSLAFYQDFGWNAEVVTVDAKHSEMLKDALFEQTIPKDIIIHRVSALSKKLTSKIGLGSLAIRSMWDYRQKVNKLLRTHKYDLIFFSTTAFPICILGAYWKQKFNIPYVIDMQDPWHSTYYQDKPKDQRPPKYWFSYRLNKWLEPMAMKYVDGIISVSEAYIIMLKNRYHRIHDIPAKVITFGYLEKDFEVARANDAQIPLPFKKDDGLIYVVYVGRGGYDMQPAIRLLLEAFKELLLEDYSRAKNLRFRFIGTSYAPQNTGQPTFAPIASELDLNQYIEESTNRVSFYQSIKALQHANAVVMPGSNDPNYTASKIYPYILSKKPLLALFNPLSSAYQIIKDCNAGQVISITNPNSNDIKTFLLNLTDDLNSNHKTIPFEFEQYSAKKMTEIQCELFNSVIIKSDV